MQKRENRKSDRKRDRRSRTDIEAQGREDRVEQGREHRFAHPAQNETGQGNPQLARAQKTVQVVKDIARGPSPTVALGPERLQLSIPNLDNGKLRRDEKSVQQNEHNHRENLEQNFHATVLNGFRDLVGSYKLTSPKIALRMSCRLTIPTSLRSRPSTIASR